MKPLLLNATYLTLIATDKIKIKEKAVKEEKSGEEY